MWTQKNKIRLAIAGIFLIAILAGVLDFSQNIQKAGITLPSFLNVPFRLGLDLQGGTHLLYEADVSQIPPADQQTATEGVRDVIERRVNAFGVAEPVVQVTKSGEKWRIVVELAGVSDVNQAIKMIGETPLLEFKEPNPNPQITLTPEQQKQLDEYNAGAKVKAEGLLAEALKPGADFAALAQKNSEEPAASSTSGDLNFIKRGALLPEFEKVCFDQLKPGEISKSLTQTSYGYHIIKKEEERGSGDSYEARCRHLLILTKTATDIAGNSAQWSYTGLTGKQLTRAVVQFDPNTQIPMISLQFNDEGKKLFGEITSRNVGKPVGIFLDGAEISTPTVQEPITDGKAVINGQFTIPEARLLAQRLNAGALPVPVTLISQQTVGASLGNNSMTKSLQAGIAGLILVSLFMILYYRLPGVTSVIALLFYGLILLAIFKLLPVTLTLAGMAGFTLSIGMAVDANVLIFERLKEELRWGKPLHTAIDEAFRRAWPSIFDGNVSTLLTCFVLMGFTTSLVKGFAVTLALGILVSMFSAMVVTRLLLKQVIKLKPLQHPRLFGVKATK